METSRSDFKKKLSDSWEHVLSHAETHVFHQGLKSLIHKTLHSSYVSFKYPVITQILAKATSVDLDCRCIQANRKSADIGNFDARSLCSKVVVPWLTENGSPFGVSADPYVNNPLRKEEFTAEFRSAQKDKAGWDNLCQLFQYLQDHPSEAEDALLEALIELRRIQKSMTLSYPIPLRVSLASTLDIIQKFLSAKSGGERLQLICYALMRAYGEMTGLFDSVATSKVNAADAAEGKAADIVCKSKGETVLAVEVKDLDFSLQALESSIRTARLQGVKELIAFVNWRSREKADLLKERIQSEFAAGMNVYVVNSQEFMEMILVLVGEEGRRAFLKAIGEGMEIMDSAFRTKKEWEALLSRL